RSFTPSMPPSQAVPTPTTTHAMPSASSLMRSRSASTRVAYVMIGFIRGSIERLHLAENANRWRQGATCRPPRTGAKKLSGGSSSKKGLGTLLAIMPRNPRDFDHCRRRNENPDRAARPAPRRDRPAAARVRGLGGLRGRAASRLLRDLAPADRDHPVLGPDGRRREARMDPRDRVLVVVRVDLLLPARAD